MQHPQGGDDVGHLWHGEQPAQADHLNRDAAGVECASATPGTGPACGTGPRYRGDGRGRRRDPARAAVRGRAGGSASSSADLAGDPGRLVGAAAR